MALVSLLVAHSARPAFRPPSLIPEDVSFVDVSSGAPRPSLFSSSLPCCCKLQRVAAPPPPATRDAQG